MQEFFMDPTLEWSKDLEATVNVGFIWRKLTTRAPSTVFILQQRSFCTPMSLLPLKSQAARCTWFVT
jgi:hypothetical protein